LNVEPCSFSSRSRAFDLPFLPDEAYIAFLALRQERIHSVHFSLFAESIPDARHAAGALPAERLAELLGRLPGPSKYALLNSRFHAPSLYTAPGLRPLLDRLEILLSGDALHGVVFADFLLLQALSDASPELCRALEAVPSVNCRVNTLDVALSMLDVIGKTRFRAPSKLLLDRNLNRRLPELRKLAQALRGAVPGLAITLMANEGCLYECPYKPAHDALIAAQRASPGIDAGAPVRELGCGRLFHEAPERLLQSPFIRPEDLDMYADIADIAKLCGRTQGGAVMRGIVSAYLAGEFDGNLLELMDAQEQLASRLKMPNAALPADFCATVANCDKRCAECGYCRELCERLLTRRGPTLNPYQRVS
jgi:collagenase-like PrtC family protease